MRLIDSCITQLKAQGPSRTCNESEEEVLHHRARAPSPATTLRRRPGCSVVPRRALRRRPPPQAAGVSPVADLEPERLDVAVQRLERSSGVSRVERSSGVRDRHEPDRPCPVCQPLYLPLGLAGTGTGAQPSRGDTRGESGRDEGCGGGRKEQGKGGERRETRHLPSTVLYGPSSTGPTKRFSDAPTS